MRNITGNSPIFLPAITRKAGAKVRKIQQSTIFFVGKFLIYSKIP